MNDNYAHEILVYEFMQKMREEEPEKYHKVCDKYAVQNRSRKATVRRREITVGLLGLTPSRVSLETATRHGVESEYTEKDG